MAAKAFSHKPNVTKVPIFLTGDNQLVIDLPKRATYPGMMTFSNALRYNNIIAHVTHVATQTHMASKSICVWLHLYYT